MKTNPPHQKKIIGLSYIWGALCATQDKLCGVYLVKTLQNKNTSLWWPLCPLRDQSLQNHHTILWSSGFLSEGKEHWQPPPLPTHTGYNRHLAHTHTEPWWGFSTEGSKFIRKQTYWKLDLNATFTFGLKFTRQTADMELCREGIEVSHRGDAVPESPPGGTRPVWPEVARLDMWLARKPAPYHWWTDWLLSWLAGRLTDWLTKRQLKGKY